MGDHPYTPSSTIRAIDELAETLRRRCGSLQDFLRVAQGGPQQWVEGKDMYDICLHSIADRACSFYATDTLSGDYQYWLHVWHRTLGAWNRTRLNSAETDHKLSARGMHTVRRYYDQLEG